MFSSVKYVQLFCEICRVNIRYQLVFGIIVIWIFQEGVVSEHNGVLKFAADGESVAHYSPLQDNETQTVTLECY